MGLDICHIILEKKNSNSIDFLYINDFKENLSFLEKHKDKIVQDGNESIIFYRELGYIRKQHNSSFVNEFKNDKLYFRKDDVENLKKYLVATENQNELENYFQQKFINNFKEGESIFFISY